MEKKLVYVSGIDFNHPNRGCQALGYGGMEFIFEEFCNNNPEEYDFIIPLWYIRRKRPTLYFPYHYKNCIINIKTEYYSLHELFFAMIEANFCRLLGIKAYSNLANDCLRSIGLFNINGGDSFSDIYGYKQYFYTSIYSVFAIFFGIKSIILPQTIGPFKTKISNFVARFILKNSAKVYVRDKAFISTLEKWKIKYEERNDVSQYMQPDYDLDLSISPESIGINISGLTYFSRYGALTGRFENYQKFIIKLVSELQRTGKTIYLVPHTYDIDGFYNAEKHHDDLDAARDCISKLSQNTNIVILEKNYTAPQLKAIISKFSAFIGTRMHACFAAIFTKTPVYGLAYSYKFSSSFEKFGLSDYCSDVIDLKEEDIDNLIQKIKLKLEIGNTF